MYERAAAKVPQRAASKENGPEGRTSGPFCVQCAVSCGLQGFCRSSRTPICVLSRNRNPGLIARLGGYWSNSRVGRTKKFLNLLKTPWTEPKSSQTCRESAILVTKERGVFRGVGRCWHRRPSGISFRARCGWDGKPAPGREGACGRSRGWSTGAALRACRSLFRRDGGRAGLPSCRW